MRQNLILPLTRAAALLAATLLPLAAQGQAAGIADATSARVIVRYKADTALLRERAQSLPDAPAVHAQRLGRRHGIVLRGGAGLHERSHVVFASGMSSEQLAARLATDSEVEYAVPDRRKRRSAAPNDPLYLGGGSFGPASGQWYLRPNLGAVKSSIDVEPAWAVSTGSSSVVVAVLDTGVRFDHPDLIAVANGGNLLPGYDMIADDDTSSDAVTGRDADASDPGDWLNQADISSGNFFPCSSADIADSSWHGTQTAALIGALTNNGLGMAGVGRGVRVLPVRVLGKCGGFDSDIIAGMRWAAGLSTGDPNVPPNPNPAKVINVSLGGGGSCSQPYADAVSAITAAGVSIVVSAGNSNGQAVQTPANCAGVIAVAGLRHVGSKVGFSSIGPEVSLAAPGGNCVNTGFGQPCLYPILAASNAGLTTPAGAIYTDSFNISVGTSFSAPLVAGTVALMLSAQPGLTPSEVRGFLRATARPFPTTGGDNGSDPMPVLRCAAPSAQQQDQCYCTSTTCGAGMLDAGLAVQAVERGVAASITTSPTTLIAGRVLTLSGAESRTLTGRTILSHQWQITQAGGIVTGFASTSGATALITPSGAGQFSVRLTVTDSAGAQASVSRDVLVQAAPNSGGGALSPAALMALGLCVVLLARRRA